MEEEKGKGLKRGGRGKRRVGKGGRGVERVKIGRREKERQKEWKWYMGEIGEWRKREN